MKFLSNIPMMPIMESPGYLQPYLNATRRYGGGFGSLLWASPRTQAARFQAIATAVNLSQQSIVDVGCGRADLLQFLNRINSLPKTYTGIEAVPDLADEAQRRSNGAQILRGDFVKNPTLMQLNADVIIFCGSLNTLPEDVFYRTLTHAFAAAGQYLVFNFLSSPLLAAPSFLTWHRSESVLTFARKFTDDVHLWDTYMPGDATVLMGRSDSWQ